VVCDKSNETTTTIITSNVHGFVVEGEYDTYYIGHVTDYTTSDLVFWLDYATDVELLRYAKPVDVDGNITALDGFAVRMQNDAETFSVGLKASDSLAADLDFVMPTADGNNGQSDGIDVAVAGQKIVFTGGGPGTIGLVKISSRTARGAPSTYTVQPIKAYDFDDDGDEVEDVMIDDGDTATAIPADTVVGPMFTDSHGTKWCWPYAIVR